MKTNHFLAVTLGLFISTSAMAKTQKATLIAPTIICDSKEDAIEASLMNFVALVAMKKPEKFSTIYKSLHNSTKNSKNSKNASARNLYRLYHESCNLLASKGIVFKIYQKSQTNRNVADTKIPVRYAQVSIVKLGNGSMDAEFEKQFGHIKQWIASPFAVEGSEIIKFSNGKKW